MSRKYRLTRAASVKLQQIWNYLAENASFEVADKVSDDLRRGLDDIASNPGVGHSREDLTKLPVKFYQIHRYLIVYLHQERPIIVAHILHTARDIRSILER